MSTSQPPATPVIGRRFIALFIDWTLAMLIAALVFGTAFPPQTSRQGFIVQGVFVVVVGLLVGVLGVSPGKWAVRLAVIGPDGRAIGWWRGLVRTALLSLVIPALVQNREGRGLHDLAVGSLVVPVVKN